METLASLAAFAALATITPGGANFLAAASGARAAHLVENAAAIDEAWLSGVSTVGLSSGASVPEILVREVTEWLAEHGFADIEEVNETEERLTFALPQELRRELRRREVEGATSAG